MKFTTVVVALASTSLVAASSWQDSAEQARDAVYQAADDAGQITFDKYKQAEKQVTDNSPDLNDKWNEWTKWGADKVDEAREWGNEQVDGVRNKFSEFDADDACPDAVVRCVRDDDGAIPKPIGDIGKKSFCAKDKGVGCKQCHSKINAAECNAKYLKDCAGKCKAIGSPI
ncbi:hypothetical protein OIO90_001505 [Microbotryomycetes sp. JL221]|nr:hypothetical protein OIO90_001505 [Microbotryomycetes sp. JL221]